MVQSVDMDNAHMVPKTAVDKKASSEPKEIEQSKVKERRRTLHTHDSALINMGVRWARWLIKSATRILSEVPIQDCIRETKIFLSQHPLAAVFVASVAVACGIPIFIFVTFAIVTILFTFCGFIIIEGAVLAAGSFALVLCLATLVIGFITLSFFGGLLYVTYMQIDSMVNSRILNGDHVQPFDSRIPQVLANFRNFPNSSRQNRVRPIHSPLSSHNLSGHVHMHDSKIVL